MNNSNDYNDNNNEHLISANRDFKTNRVAHNYTYNLNNSPKKKGFSLKSSKSQTIVATAIITGIIIWLFQGSHNDTPISQIISLENKLSSQVSLEYTIQQPNQPIVVKQESLTNAPDIPELITTNNEETIKTKVKKNESLWHIFNRLKLSQDDLTKIITNSKINQQVKKLQAGQELTIKLDKTSRKISSISYFVDKFNLYVIKQDQNNSDLLIGKITPLDLTEKTTFAQLTINSSLFEDAVKQKLDSNLIFQLIDIFTWDIDFAQDLRKGDTVDILYTEYYHKGAPYTTGPILAVNFTNNGTSYKAVRFENDNKADYYTPEGRTLRKAFIRTPVKFTRISSRFSLGRKHPILHRIRAHRGVDYAAPTGTPIKAAGDGKIIHYGRKGGYGKAAIIQHGSKYTTLYAHMSRYQKNIRNGSTVKQGQIIGYVGQTGLASGPHLHFEFRVNGAHKNPLTVPLPKAKPIDDKYKNIFASHANELLANLEKFSNHMQDHEQVASTKDTNFE